jgi:hypothetical protein
LKPTPARCLLNVLLGWSCRCKVSAAIA